jgi:hypothetical protein
MSQIITNHISATATHKHKWSGCKLIFFAMLPPDMAWIAIRVLGQCQKHGALLADDTAKWGFA